MSSFGVYMNEIEIASFKKLLFECEKSAMGHDLMEVSRLKTEGSEHITQFMCSFCYKTFNRTEIEEHIT